MSRLVAIATAVATMLAAKSFTLPSGVTFSVTRTYTPPVNIEDGDNNIKLFVWPGPTRAIGIATREALEDEATVSIGIVRKFPDREADALRTSVDEMLLIVDEVIKFIAAERAEFSEGAFVGMTNSPPYSQDDLEQKGMFVTIVAVQYRMEASMTDV